ncbi:hypothetical protein C5F47_07680 [Nitrosopumilus cobalaminigenes]|uniref:Uncharacterized protein n=1 Tax=Nitrosopumilus cobalaminigenes TaxID=1470066 RepID=A0A7D5LZV6_9ARCH|nr:hypothetical protein [Nitrosopumilus cobalaminigenes]QLH03433.1 hypothetical protein C5F47_07680 [Nitrosopumilus cobalaminigenes]
MVIPIIVLVSIPIFLGIVYMPPYDLPVEEEPREIPEEHDVSVLYYILMGIWTLYLIKILLQVKRKTFKVTQRY